MTPGGSRNHLEGWVLVGVVGVVLAGCLGNPTATGDGPASSKLPSVFAFPACRHYIGSFSVDADAVQSSLPAGFEVVRDETGARTNLQAAARTCGRAETFEPYVEVTPPKELLNASIDSYRMTEGGYVADPGLLSYYNRSGLSPAYLPGLVDVVETKTAEVLQGTVSTDGARGPLSLEWRRVSGPPAPAPARFRSFVMSSAVQPGVVLGYCDEDWSSGQSVAGGAAFLDGIGSLVIVAVPPGTMTVLDVADETTACHRL